MEGMDNARSVGGRGDESRGQDNTGDLYLGRQEEDEHHGRDDGGGSGMRKASSGLPEMGRCVRVGGGQDRSGSRAPSPAFRGVSTGCPSPPPRCRKRRRGMAARIGIEIAARFGCGSAEPMTASSPLLRHSRNQAELSPFTATARRLRAAFR